MLDRVVVVGAGVVGLSIARVLSALEGLEVVVVEKEADVGWGASKANTGIIHSGYDDDPVKYPNRARLAVKGNRLWTTWAEQLSIPVDWCGSLVLARSSEDRRVLRELLARGIRNGVPALRILDGEEVRALEPMVSEDVVEALWSPTAGVLSPYEATVALAENCVENGVKILTETLVKGVRVKGGSVEGVETSRGFIGARWVVNAAGLYADEIARMAGVSDYTITPRRGEYLVFDKDAGPKPSRILFPSPTPVSKGVVVETTVAGNLMIGPNAVDLPRDAKEETYTTKEGLAYVWREASKLVKKLPGKREVIRVFSGLRPQPSGGDFIVRVLEEPEGFVEAAGMRSPGLAAAPAVALEILRLMRLNGLDHGFKKRWKAERRAGLRIMGLGWDMLEKTVPRNPSYGRVVCWCEGVTEGEVVDAIRRGAKTIDGVKFRTRAGMGRCQGAFCRLRIAAILARELGKPIWSITVKGTGSELGVGDVKSLLEGEDVAD